MNFLDLLFSSLAIILSSTLHHMKFGDRSFVVPPFRHHGYMIAADGKLRSRILEFVFNELLMYRSLLMTSGVFFKENIFD